ncbi:helix-turn-helix domain-containing protein [Paenibacillus sp. CECT 9249]|uniref:helix-turn-helix domain-containing protein n=1 Tax=Paenibacillus sp. CECT 9249 TaxID=2845385 RepID=UPI0033A350A3
MISNVSSQFLSECSYIVKIAKLLCFNFKTVALDLGYHDQTHLIKAFKSVIGMTPDEFRKRRASGGESLPVEGV